MIRTLDPYNLRLFTLTAREGSIARAAQAGNIAPSALSRRLADLEHALGAALLVRSPRGIELTDAGQLVLARAERMDHDLRQLVAEVQALGSEVRACLDDRADVGVAVAVDAPPGVETWAFASDPLMVVLPAGHALAHQRALRFAQVLDWPLVGVNAGGSLDQTLHQRAAALRRSVSFAVSVNSFDAVCRMVEAGLGIAVVPESAASAYAGTRRFVRRALDEPWAARELRVYALRKAPRLRAVQALIDALRLPV